MIFKHEYIVHEEHPDKERAHEYKRDYCEYELGKLIASTFGWRKKECPAHLIKEGDTFKLEIIAFTMEDWAIFRRRLNFFLPNKELDTIFYDLEHGDPLSKVENNPNK